MRSVSLITCGLLLAVSNVLAGSVVDAAGPDAGIPIRFKLDHPGIVTLVVDDATGHRVRNLIADQPFQAGDQTVYWDGLDESGGLQPDAKGIYKTTGKPAAPGTYHAHGIVHDAIGLRYEFSVYTAGNPAWRTQANTGRWLADHTPPLDALYLPARGELPPRVLLASYVAEGGDALVWTDLEGKRLDGLRWIGGDWTGALAIARDEGMNADKNDEVYTVSSWLIPANQDGKDKSMIGEFRLCALDGRKPRQIWSDHFDPAPLSSKPVPVAPLRASDKRYVGGLAVRDGVAVINLVRHGELRFIDVRTGHQIGTVPLADARGLAFDEKGRLLAAVGDKLCRFEFSQTADGISLGKQQVIAEGLGNLNRVTVDAITRSIYVSDWASNTIKVLDADGKTVRHIGTPGGVVAGKYDPTRLQNPSGMAVLPNGQVWVAEENYSPKRISIWSDDGSFIKALYGPPHYGGGGNISSDKKKFYYFDFRAMAFDIDWRTGTWSLSSILADPADDKISLYAPPRLDKHLIPGIDGGPQTPIDLNGHRYLTNVFSGTEEDEVTLAALWMEQGDRAEPVAVVGDASKWPLMYQEKYRTCLPPGTDLTKYVPGRSPIFVAWSDRNGDGLVQPEEVSSRKLEDFGAKTGAPGVQIGCIFIGADLAINTTFSYQMKPKGFSESGIPLYDATDMSPGFKGPIDVKMALGHDVLTAADGYTVVTGSPLRGFKDGKLVWTYPNGWPSLHAGHDAPPQQYPGQLIAMTKILGLPVTVPGSEGEPIWAYNSDRGSIVLMTTDGIYVAQLFKTSTIDKPKTIQWADVPAVRDMDVSQFAVPGENFLPSINQTSDGQVYLVTGKEHSSLVRVTGLDTIRKLADIPIEITSETVIASAKAPVPVAKGELQVMRLPATSVVDGKMNEWATAHWVDLDQTAQASIGVTNDRLWLAYRTNDSDLLNNKPDDLAGMFKTGGALDLMLCTDPAAKPSKDSNLRLLITQVDGKPKAAIYLPVTKGDRQPVQFSSPWRTITFDRVDDVSSAVKLAHDAGNYECSIPLATLGLKVPALGVHLRGDIGILRGQPGKTSQRLYWSNKETGIVEDVPSEAELTPQRWGQITIPAAPLNNN